METDFYPRFYQLFEHLAVTVDPDAFIALQDELLAAENDAERLIKYVEKHLSAQELENYYEVFAPVYPEETLALFKKALIPYAEKNVGRRHYEYILELLRKMSRIQGGKTEALDLAADFRIRYRNRKAMLEVLSQL